MSKNIRNGIQMQNIASTNIIFVNYQQNTNKIPVKILDELSCRFIINIPVEERDDIIRVLFQIELAHWFYLDFHCIENANLVKYAFREFSRIIFSHIPFLNPYLIKLETHIEQWREYKLSVPTCGAILLDESLEFVLLVQGFWSKGGWGFPKGKINADEDPLVCAVREVREETGYDCELKINENEFIESKLRDTSTRLYIVSGVDKNQVFKPISRNEIKHIEWFKVADLPQNKRDMTFKQNLQLNANCFFMVIPFVKPIRRWIATQRQLQNVNSQKRVKSNYSKFGRKSKFWAKSWDNFQLDWDKIWKI